MIEKFTGIFRQNSNKSDNSPIDVLDFQRKINYTFQNQNLLIQAVSHRSFYVNSEKQISSNERLEFLGDAVLDLVVTEHLFNAFKNENEGALSQKKAILVSRKVLGKISEDLGLGEFLILNKGEEKTGGRKRMSNLANLFEAILGAIYMDSGLDAARIFVDEFLLKQQKKLLKTKSYFNYKSLLLEFSQAKGWGAPKYFVMQETGPDHQKTFLVEVRINDEWAEKGQGPNKKSAEQNAAKNALKLMSTNFKELADIFKN